MTNLAGTNSVRPLSLIYFFNMLALVAFMTTAAPIQVHANALNCEAVFKKSEPLAPWPVENLSPKHALFYDTILVALLKRQQPDFKAFDDRIVMSAIREAFYSTTFLPELSARIQQLSGGDLTLEKADPKTFPYLVRGRYWYLQLVSKSATPAVIRVGIGPYDTPVTVYDVPIAD